MKTRYDNYVISHTDAIYVKKKNELPWLIGLVVVYGEIETELLAPIKPGVVCDEN